MPKASSFSRLVPAVLVLCVLVACADSPSPSEAISPVIVIGFDGGEWSVIRSLWAEGRLPHLKALAERGVTADLQTDYGVSPVIWTTIATGREARDHGITDFVVAGPQGNVPVSSGLRRAPALWNLATLLRKSVAVLGWYVTWPAEEVNGVVVSDNVMRPGLDDRVHPPELQPEIDARLAEVRALPSDETYPFGVALQDRRVTRDLLIERLGPEYAAQGYDLLLVYFRVIDHLSHFYWKFWEPTAYENVDPAEVAEKGDWIPAGYERFDRAVGEIVAAAPDSNILVVSDHGFNAVPEQLRIYLEMDKLLHHLGYLEWNDEGVDMAASRAFTHGTARSSIQQEVRLTETVGAGTTDPAERRELLMSLRGRLITDLESVRYESGKPVFAAKPRRRRPGIVRVDVLQEGFSRIVTAGGRQLNDVIAGTESISGSHLPDKAGVFIASGPDIRPGTDVTGISIFDITPTVLYGLGLPVAEDFPGRAFMEIFKRPFRDAHPLRTIPTWGELGEGTLRESAADEEIIEELRALGYLQ